MSQDLEDQIEKLTRQLATERLGHAIGDLRRQIMVGGGFTFEEADKLAVDESDRLSHDSGGKLEVRLQSGGVATGDRGLKMLAREIHTREAMRTVAASKERLVEQKRNDPMYSNVL